MKGSMTGMTPEQEQAIRERHQEAVWERAERQADGTVVLTPIHTKECVTDDQPWPCDTARVLAALEFAEAKLGKTWGTIIDGHRKELDAALAREEALADALRYLVDCWYGSGYDPHKGYADAATALAAHEEARR